MYKLIKQLIALSLISLMASTSHAATINFDFTGIVDASLDTQNKPGDQFLFGLAPTDTINVFGSYDDSGLTGGSGILTFADFTDFTLNVGTETFLINANTQLALDNSNLTALNYTSSDGVFVSINMNFVGDENTDGSGDFHGHWEDTAVVPVPAAVWLFGSGLIALFGFARRKTA